MTHVTQNRDPLLIDNFDFLRQAISSVQMKLPYELIAWVAIPDHFHLIIDPDVHDFSGLMRRIKLSFSAHLRKREGVDCGRVWQYRFWDHIIRDQDDLNRHIDYIHYNPVKHGLVASPFDHPYSSIHEYRKRGYYRDDWGTKEEIIFDGKFGE
ncbi:MAG: transposase [Pseudomonadota bacterium]